MGTRVAACKFTNKNALSMNTLTVTKTCLILGKIGGVQISHHSQIVIKSDNGGRYPESDN